MDKENIARMRKFSGWRPVDDDIACETIDHYIVALFLPNALISYRHEVKLEQETLAVATTSACPHARLILTNFQPRNGVKHGQFVAT